MSIVAIIFGALYILSEFIGENTKLNENSIYAVIKTVLGAIANGLKK